MPAGKTTGWLKIRDTSVTIDTSRSKTWYDRARGNAAQSWYWLKIHIEPMAAYPRGTVLSVWNWIDNISDSKNFATTSNARGIQSVVAVKSFSRNLTSAWASTAHREQMGPSFELILEDVTFLSLLSIKEGLE